MTSKKNEGFGLLGLVRNQETQIWNLMIAVHEDSVDELMAWGKEEWGIEQSRFVQLASGGAIQRYFIIHLSDQEAVFMRLRGIA